MGAAPVTGRAAEKNEGDRPKAERLQREFADRSVHRDDGPLLLRPDDALALVSRAADEGVPIVGVLGARGTDTPVALPLERLADYSAGVAQGRGCWQDAEALIRARGGSPGMSFALSLGGDPIEAV